MVVAVQCWADTAVTFCCSGGDPWQPWSSSSAFVSRFHSSFPLSHLSPSLTPWMLSNNFSLKMHNLVELWSLLALFFSKVFDQTKSRLVNDLQMWGYSTLKVFEGLGLKDWCLVPPPPPPISLHSVETLGFATSHLGFVQNVCPAKPAPHRYKRNTILLFGGRAQELSENCGGHPGLPVPNSMYSLFSVDIKRH